MLGISKTAKAEDSDPASSSVASAIPGAGTTPDQILSRLGVGRRSPDDCSCPSRHRESANSRPCLDIGMVGDSGSGQFARPGFFRRGVRRRSPDDAAGPSGRRPADAAGCRPGKRRIGRIQKTRPVAKTDRDPTEDDRAVDAADQAAAGRRRIDAKTGIVDGDSPVPRTSGRPARRRAGHAVDTIIEHQDAQQRYGPPVPAQLHELFLPSGNNETPLTISGALAVASARSQGTPGGFYYGEFSPDFFLKLNDWILLEAEIGSGVGRFRPARPFFRPIFSSTTG